MLQIENIHSDLGCRLGLKKSLNNENDIIITLDDKAILNSKNIKNQYITFDDEKVFVIIVEFFSEPIHKNINIKYEIKKNTINISLLNGLRKKSYIKEYTDYLDKHIHIHRPLITSL